MAEGQHRFARIGGAGAGKEIGGLFMTLLVHPHQPGQVQQPGVGGERASRGAKARSAPSGSPACRAWLGQRQGLLKGGICRIVAMAGHPIGAKRACQGKNRLRVTNYHMLISMAWKIAT